MQNKPLRRGPHTTGCLLLNSFDTTEKKMTQYTYSVYINNMCIYIIVLVYIMYRSKCNNENILNHYCGRFSIAYVLISCIYFLTPYLYVSIFIFSIQTHLLILFFLLILYKCVWTCLNTKRENLLCTHHTLQL